MLLGKHNMFLYYQIAEQDIIWPQTQFEPFIVQTSLRNQNKPVKLRDVTVLSAVVVKKQETDQMT